MEKSRSFQHPHVITCYVAKFHDFLSLFSFYILKKNDFTQLGRHVSGGKRSIFHVAFYIRPGNALTIINVKIEIIK